MNKYQSCVHLQTKYGGYIKALEKNVLSQVLRGSKQFPWELFKRI